jgi:hypothetical protein
MYLAEIWRYPVKSMAGEQLEQVFVGPTGVEGDRVVQVWSGLSSGLSSGQPSGQGGAHPERRVTARTRPRLLGHRAVLGADGEPLVDGRPWRDPTVAADVERAAGPGTRLVRLDEVEARYDILPLLVATDGAINSLGLDRRRFRPNLLIGGVEGLAERDWQGRRLRVGEAVIALADLRGRCVMTTFDPDTQEQDPLVMRRIVEQLGGVLGLNAEVARAGVVRVGDPVELV